MAPEQLGPYDILERIGSGGFATVYRGRDRRLDQEVAIKILADNHSLDPDVRSRFVEEARLLRRVSHPNLVRLFDLGETDRGQPYLVLEYAARGSLAGRMAGLQQRGYAVTANELHRVAGDLAAAITALHANRVVHRDINPRNLLIAASTEITNGGTPLLGGDERLILTDLGYAKDLARHSGLTTGGGTSGFIPPEQEAMGTVDARADVYAASAVLVWLTTGRPPRSGWEKAVPRPLAAVVPALRCGLEPDPARRPATAQAWLTVIETALPAAAAFGPTPAPSTLLPHRRLIRLAAAGLAAATLAVAVLVVGGGPDLERRADGAVAVSDSADQATVTISGPGTVGVGDVATYVVETTGVDRWAWIAPEGTRYPDSDGIQVEFVTAGNAEVRLDAVTPSGEMISLVLPVTVDSPSS